MARCILYGLRLLSEGCSGISWQLVLGKFFKESKMETIRKKLDVLKHSLKDAEERAKAAEKVLDKQTQRSERVRAS